MHNARIALYRPDSILNGNPSTQVLEVRHVPFSLDLTKPSEFAFIPKKEPLVVSEEVFVKQPRGFRERSSRGSSKS